MKKILGLAAALMIVLSSLAYAGGDQNCGHTGAGDTGKNAPGTASQTRSPNP